MHRKGTSILLLDARQRVLLQLRDNIPLIPFANMWDVPGGHVEAGETPEACILREIREEMGVSLAECRLFCVREFRDRTEYTFWQRIELDISRVTLTEGQRLRWFTETEAAATPLAYGFNEIVADFYAALRSGGPAPAGRSAEA